MTKFEAIRWMEQWAERWDVRLEPWRPLRPGESYVGLVRMPAGVIPYAAIDELMERASDLTFAESYAASVGSLGDPAAADDKTQTPTSNTGGRLTSPLRGLQAGLGLSVACDWFNGVGRGEDDRAAVLAAMQEYLGEGQAGLFGRHTYRESWRWDSGAMLLWSEDRADFCLVVNGGTFEVVGEERHIEFLQVLGNLNLRATRFDVRLDDYTRKLIDLDTVEAARQACNFTGFRVSGRTGDDRMADGKLVGLGMTIHFGRRGRDGSGIFLRFYDKGMESKGRIMSNRMEVEYSKHHAAAAFLHFLEAVAEGQAAGKVLGELVTGAIDFVDRKEKSVKHVARMERLSWYAAIVDAIGQMRVKVTRAKSTLTSAVQAFANQYARVLARACVVAEAMGHDLRLKLWDLLDLKRDGQELEERELTPVEALFDPLRPFSWST